MNAPRDRLTPDAVRLLTTDPEPWLSCDDCFRLADRYVERRLGRDSALTDAEDRAMQVHLAGCAACAEEATSLLVLAADAGIDPE